MTTKRSKKAQPKAKAKSAAPVEAKAQENGAVKEYWKIPEAIETVAYLAREVAGDNGEFSASDIMRFLGFTENLGQQPWVTLGVIMKANPGVFTRSGPRAKWALANGNGPEEEEEPEELAAIES